MAATVQEKPEAMSREEAESLIGRDFDSGRVIGVEGRPGGHGHVDGVYLIVVHSDRKASHVKVG